MKLVSRFTGLGLLGGLLLCAVNSRATFEVSASVQINARADFEVPLAAQGTWVEVRGYGRCWHPVHVAVGWRPYCEGRWVWTDCGWYWQSDEPWAWACYHYGRWTYDSSLGWVWIPGVEWAPSWVYWRSGGGYIGWAPCPPVGVVVEPGFFAFVAVGNFNQPIRTRNVIVNNTTIINKTTVINNVRQETRTVAGHSRKVFVNDGPGATAVQQAARKTEKPVPIQVAALHSAPSTTVVRQVKESQERTHAATRTEQLQPNQSPRHETPAPIAPPETRQPRPKSGAAIPHTPSVSPEDKRPVMPPHEEKSRPHESGVPPGQTHPVQPPANKQLEPTKRERPKPELEAPAHEQPRHDAREKPHDKPEN